MKTNSVGLRDHRFSQALALSQAMASVPSGTPGVIGHSLQVRFPA